MAARSGTVAVAVERLHLNQHTSAQFDADLERVRERVLAMGGLVEQQVAAATRAVVHGELAAVAQILLDERRVNIEEVEIDELCTTLLARRQPTAGDLRAVLGAIKTVADLERIGDEAERISRVVARFAEVPVDPGIRAQFEAMGERVRAMLRRVLDAYARLDIEAAVLVIRDDRAVDRRYELLVQGLVESMRVDPESIQAGLELLFAVRSLERVGDRCRNIAEYVACLVQGQDVRHQRFGDATPA